jgi:hypothetical protein
MNSQQGIAICRDEAPLIPELVLIQCFTMNGNSLVTEPSLVAPGGAFTVQSSAGPLPSRIECVIQGPTGPLQRNILDTSGNVPLFLGDNYGALLLERCGDLNCRETFLYDAQIRNVGSVPMLVDLLEFTFNGVKMSLLDSVAAVNTVAVGQSVSAGGPLIEVDVCISLEYSARVSVAADPPDGPLCQDSDDLIIATFFDPEVTSPASLVDPPAPPNPDKVCSIVIDTLCVIGGDTAATGLACSSQKVGIEPCVARPTSATMLLNGGDCSNSDNSQGLKFNCTDLGGPGVPKDNGSEVHILVTDIEGKGIIYHDGLARVGDFYSLDNGGTQFKADQLITISTPDRSTTLQQVQYHSSCSSSLELKNRFGASQLVSFSNEIQGNVTCFNVFEFSLNITIPTATASSDSLAKLTSLVVMTNFAGTIDLTNQVQNQTIGSDGDVVVTFSGTVDTSVRREYSLLLIIEGVDGDRSDCSGMSTWKFEAGYIPGTPGPSSIGLTPSAASDANNGMANRKYL